MPPVGAAIAGIAAAVGGFVTTTLAAGGIGAFLLKTAGSIALSLVAQRLQRPRSPQAAGGAGIVTDVTTSGSTAPGRFILGRTATAGHLVAPPMSFTPDNRVLVYVTELSDVPGIDLVGVIINGERWNFGPWPNWEDWNAQTVAGRALLKPGTDDTPETRQATVRFHAGYQTEADRYLRAELGSYPERPWTANHIGHGIAYAVTSFVLNRDRFGGSFPTLRFEVLGIPVYDPREDSSVGGDGPQRWDNPATWARSENLAVLAYNVLRGIPLPGGKLWGGKVPAADLPLANWITAMNACEPDEDFAGFLGGTEVMLTEPPARVLERLLDGCLGRLAEQGGVWRIRVGAPAAPVFSLTRGDLIVGEADEETLHPELGVTYNGASARYVEPASIWEPTEAPAVRDEALEEADGEPRVLSIDLPVVSNVNQARHIAAALLRDSRRFLSATITAGPEASRLELLDVVSLDGKAFEMVGVSDDPRRGVQVLTLREVDPEDFDPPAPIPLPEPVNAEVAAQTVTLGDWDATPAVLLDGSEAGRRPGIKLAWNPALIADCDQIRWEVRLAGGAVVASGIADHARGEVFVWDGILPAEGYEARGRPVLERPTAWTVWEPVTAPDLRFGTEDLAANAATVVATAFTSGTTTLTRPTGGAGALVTQSVTMTLPAGARLEVFATQQLDVTAASSTRFVALASVSVTDGTTTLGGDNFNRNYASATNVLTPVTLTGSFVIPAAGVWTISLAIGGTNSFDNSPTNPWAIVASQRSVISQWLKR